MSVIYLLLPLAVILALAFVFMFIWATRDGQFDDVETPRIRILFDDEASQPVAGAPACGQPRAYPIDKTPQTAGANKEHS